MTRIINHMYPLQLWVTAIAAGPVLFVIYTAFRKQDFHVLDIVPMFIFLFIISAVFSLPTLVLFCLAFRRLAMTKISAGLLKISLACFGIVCMLASIYFLTNLFDPFDTEVLVLEGMFAVSIISGSYYFNIEQPDINETS